MLIVAALAGIGFLILDATISRGAVINLWIDAALAGVAPIALVASIRGLALLIRTRHPLLPTPTYEVGPATAGPDSG